MGESKTPKISVIMPVYNAKQYLAMAIDSVLNQTFQDFELLLIDDGSKDGSEIICDEYAAKDPRVRAIHQENGGICAARNAGMNAAIGEYLAFIDNDDEYLPDLLKDNYALAKEYDADVVKYGYRVEETFSDGYVDNREQVAEHLTLITSTNLADCYSDAKNSGSFYMIWNGLYKKSFLAEKNLTFNEQCKYGYEDWIFNSLLYSEIEQMVLAPKVQYVHYQRENFSTSKKYHDNQLTGCLLSCQCEQDMLDTIGIEKVLPFKKEEALISVVIEILLRLNNPHCHLTTKEKAERLLKIRQAEIYRTRLTEAALNKLKQVSKTKYTVAKLFYNQKMRTLILLSKGYFAYLHKKKKR